MYQRILIFDEIDSSLHEELHKKFDEGTITYFDDVEVIGHDFNEFDGFQIDILEPEKLTNLAKEISGDYRVTAIIKCVNLDEHYYGYFEYYNGELEWHDIRTGDIESVNDPYYDTVINKFAGVI